MWAGGWGTKPNPNDQRPGRLHAHQPCSGIDGSDAHNVPAKISPRLISTRTHCVVSRTTLYGASSVPGNALDARSDGIAVVGGSRNIRTEQ